MSRLGALLIALAFAFPIAGSAGTAEAQVWKVKKGGKPGAKPAKKANARAGRPALKKKSVKAKKRPVEVAPEEDDDSDVATEAEPRDRDRDRDREPIEDDEPVVIRVEEVFD